MSDGKEFLIFFSAPIERVEKTIIRLGKWMETTGIIILNEHVVSENPREILAGKLNKPINEITIEDIKDYNISRLCIANYVIAEVSGANIGVEEEVEFARTKGHSGLALAKILCLYRKGCEHSVPPTIRGMNDPYVEVSPYGGIKEAKHLARKFLGI